jgi:hypothetical protein
MAGSRPQVLAPELQRRYAAAPIAQRVTAFDIHAWNGTVWVTVGSVAGNNLVKRTVSFTATTTSKIRVLITTALVGKAFYSFVTEVEAWTAASAPPPPPGTTLVSALNPAKVNQSVNFTATVTSTNPTGSVAFTRNGSSIADCTAVALAGSGNPDGGDGRPFAPTPPFARTRLSSRVCPVKWHQCDGKTISRFIYT